MLAASAIFAACTPNNNNPTPAQTSNPTPIPASNSGLYWIPNWQTDTLLGMLMPSQEWDTMYSYSRNDTSFVNYKGVEYYIWIDTKYTPYKENNEAYPLCYVGTTAMNNDNSLTSCSVIVGKWYNYNYNEWHTSRQSVTLTLKPPFPSNVMGSTYMKR